MKSIHWLGASLVLLVAGLAWAAAPTRAPANMAAYVSATACLTPADRSTVSIAWTRPTNEAGEGPSAYVWGLLLNGNTTTPAVMDTVAASVTSAQHTLPCPAMGDSVTIVAAVAGIDARGVLGAPGMSRPITIRTRVPGPLPAPQVEIDTVPVVALRGVGRILYDPTPVVVGDEIQLCYVVDYDDGSIGMDPDIPYCRGLAGIALDQPVQSLAFWATANVQVGFGD